MTPTRMPARKPVMKPTTTMQMIRRYTPLVLACGLTGCAFDARPGEAPSESLEAHRIQTTEIAVSWRPIDFSADAAAFSFELAIENRGHAALGSSGWHLYFNFVRRLLPARTPHPPPA